ncbi:protein KINESIN LIGHT CHAIN-RELATED 2-like [Silene latifolia]|uniref:protein KINESIN LIGHT CHAIN-RELATED 2-like n=1 Tax=Silene latifolia TaxID=37657 RepID=UPI003D789BEC
MHLNLFVFRLIHYFGVIPLLVNRKRKTIELTTLSSTLEKGFLLFSSDTVTLSSFEFLPEKKMKRATTKLISCSKITTSSTSISGNFTPQFTTSSSSISNSPIQQSCTQTLKPCSNSNELFYKPYKTHHFHNNPSQNYSTHVGITPYFPSNHSNNTHVEITPYFPFNQRKILEAAKSAEEMLEAFKKMEANLDEVDIGLACMEIAFQLDKEGKDPEKIVSFANRALAVFDKEGENECSLYIVMILGLLGSTYNRLRKFNDALDCVNRAKMILVKLENDGKPVLHAEGMMEALVDKLRKLLENIELSLEEKEKESREFGNANRQFAETSVDIKNFKDGMSYCLKALEIHLRLFGENSVEVARDRRVLGVIYAGMEEYEKALDENLLAQKVFKNCGCSSDLLQAVIDATNIYIDLGMYEAAMNTLEGVVQDSENRTRVLVSMANVLVLQEKFDDAKRCLENACSVLEKKEKSKPLEVSTAYMEIAMEYQTMNEFEKAISLLKRALALLEKLPDQQHFEASVSGRIGFLLLLTDKVTEALPYLERAVETMKESFVTKRFIAGYIYNNLGVGYLELERPQSAAQMFSAAKDIMDASSLGPHHNDSIQACQNLSKAYAAMKSYPLAIEFQQKAVDAWEGHGSSEEDELREARQLLEQLKAIACGASSKDFPTKALPLPYWAYRAARRGLQVPQPSSPKQSG